MKTFSILALGVSLALSPLATAADPAPNTAESSASPKNAQRCKGKGPHKDGKEPKQHKMGKALAKKLNLTDSQQEQVKAIMEGKRPQIEAIRQEERDKMKVVMDDAKKQIRGILTPEQIKELDELEQARADRKAKKGD